MDVICAGEMLIDFSPGKEPDTYTANPGGAPANVAVSMARNDINTAFLGILGNDDFGKKLKKVLDSEKIEMLCPNLTDEAVTTLAFVTLYGEGERSFTFARKPGADILLRKESVREEDIERTCMLHAGSVSLSEEPCRESIVYAMSLAHQKGKIVSFDINYRDMIWHDMDKCKREVEKILPYVDFLKISDEEVYFVGGEENIPSFMKTYGITVLVETLGSEGAKYFFNGMSGIVEGKKVEAVDTTGAGDAFWGGFLSKILMFGIKNTADVTEQKVKEAVEYGNVSGALCVRKKGGIPALPTRKEIEEVL